LDVVELRELAVVVIGDEGHEFLFGLLVQVPGVDEEENAAGSGMLQQAVDLRDCGEGLAGAGRAIWTSTRGLSAFSETSRLTMALTWHSRRPAGSNGGSATMPDRNERWRSVQALRVSGRWKVKISGERGLGSRPLVNRVTHPVLS